MSKCKNCRKDFKKKRTTHKFCSEKCQRKYAYIKDSRAKGRFSFKGKNIKKKCPSCGKIFVLICHNKRYCSTKCLEKEFNKTEKGRTRWRKYDKIHREDRRRRDRKYQPEEFVNLVNSCKECGRSFKPTDKFHPFQYYCSNKCRDKFTQRKYNKTEKAKLRILRYIKRHPGALKEAYNRYAKTEKAKANKFRKTQKRRAKIKEQLIITIPYQKYKMIFQRDVVCIYCGSDKAKTLDHIISINKNGSNHYNNLVLCCRSCNASKSDRDVFEWCKSKDYDVPEIVIELLKKQKEQNKL